MATFVITVTSSDKNANASPHHDALKLTIKAAAALLVDFWPTEPEHGQLSIEIVAGSKIEVDYWQQGRAQPIQRIQFGVDALTIGPGHELRRFIHDDLPIVLHLLGHETFHLTQAERIIRSGGDTGLLASGFAQGLQPTMSQEWKEVGLALADSYRHRGAMIPPIAKAADIVSELRADIRGLNALKWAKMDWQGYAAVLHSVRESDEKANPASYQIADAMAVIVTDRLPSEIEAIPRLWHIALDQLATMQLPNEINKMIQAAKPKLALTGTPKTVNRPS
jgi:hypothetical protein